MKRHKQSSMTQRALQALREAVDQVLEDHRRRGIPVAVWRDGRAVSVPPTELGALHERPISYRTKPDGTNS
jgi:hypothetical protein